MFANVGRMPQAKQFSRQSTRISPSKDLRKSWKRKFFRTPALMCSHGKT